MSEITTELGLTVPLPGGEEYREHTAERWKERDASSYQFALYLVRELGLTNKSEMVRLVTDHRKARGFEGISRNTIIGFFNSNEFKPGEIDEIIKRRALLTTADALEKIEELLDKASVAKDLGAVAMALTSVYNVKQLSSGAATRISSTATDQKKVRLYDHFLKLAQEKQAATAVRIESPNQTLEAEIISPSNEALHRPGGAGSVARGCSPAERGDNTAATEGPHSSAQRMNVESTRAENKS